MVAQAQEEQTIVRKLGKVEQPGAAYERKNKNITSINLTKSALALYFVFQVSSLTRDDLGVGWGGGWRVSRGTWDGSLASTGLYSHSLVFVFVCVSVFVFVFLPFLLSSSLSMFQSLFRFSWLCRCGCSCICLCFVSFSPILVIALSLIECINHADNHNQVWFKHVPTPNFLLADSFPVHTAQTTQKLLLQVPPKRFHCWHSGGFRYM